jgi:hypothetical protein
VVGYGYRSIEAIIDAILRVEAAPPAGRAAILREIDDAGIIATPANSSFNETVLEAGRLSILHGGREAVIEPGDPPRVRLK